MKSEVLVVLGVAGTLAFFAGCKPDALLQRVKNRLAGQRPSTPEWEQELKGKIGPDPFTVTNRAKWHRLKIVSAYKEHGKRDPRWDAAAIELMEKWVPVVMSEDFSVSVDTEMEVLGTEAKRLVALGCDDPMVLYVEARYAGFGDGLNENQWAAEWEKVGLAAANSSYPPARKFWVFLRTANAMGYATPLPQKKVQFFWDHAYSSMEHVAKDPKTPEEELLRMCSSFYAIRQNFQPSVIHAWQGVEQALQRSQRENSFIYHVLHGLTHIEHAWEARGDGWANTVSAQGWKLFYERLSVAEKSLVTAWYQRPDDWRAPTYMLQVELGLGRGRAEMEKWFQRAMTANPNNHEAASRKSHYLQPRWHGSKKDLLSYAEELNASKSWGGLVPLHVVDVHELIAGLGNGSDAHFRKPEVWQQINSVYERHLNTYPNDHFRRTVYAKFALRCGQPKKARQLFDQLGVKADKDAFGGPAELARAQAQARR